MLTGRKSELSGLEVNAVLFFPFLIYELFVVLGLHKLLVTVCGGRSRSNFKE